MGKTRDGGFEVEEATLIQRRDEAAAKAHAEAIASSAREHEAQGKILEALKGRPQAECERILNAASVMFDIAPPFPARLKELHHAGR